jgi:hypothetical protein
VFRGIKRRRRFQDVEELGGAKYSPSFLFAYWRYHAVDFKPLERPHGCVVGHAQLLFCFARRNEGICGKQINQGHDMGPTAGCRCGFPMGDHLGHGIRSEKGILGLCRNPIQKILNPSTPIIVFSDST